MCASIVVSVGPVGALKVSIFSFHLNDKGKHRKIIISTDSTHKHKLIQTQNTVIQFGK